MATVVRNKLPSYIDSVWKDALSAFLKNSLELFFPDIYLEIDWNHPIEILDQEFENIIKYERDGKGLVDKLFKVRKLNGQETIIHIEVENRNKKIKLPKRIFIYHYRIFEFYQCPVMSIVILLDNDLNWRPNVYKTEIWNCRLLLEYPIIKLAEYRNKKEFLMNSMNPFATVILAQLAANESNYNPTKRLNLSFNIMESLYKKGWDGDRVRLLLKFIDGLLKLPEAFELELRDRILKLESEENMSYVTCFERFAKEEGIQMGIQMGEQNGIQKGESLVLLSLLEEKFPQLSVSYHEKIKKANPDILLTWAKRILKANTLEEVFGTS